VLGYETSWTSPNCSKGTWSSSGLQSRGMFRTKRLPLLLSLRLPPPNPFYWSLLHGHCILVAEDCSMHDYYAASLTLTNNERIKKRHRQIGTCLIPFSTMTVRIRWREKQKWDWWYLEWGQRNLAGRDELEQRASVSQERDEETKEGMNDWTLFYNKLYTKNIFLIKNKLYKITYEIIL